MIGPRFPTQSSFCIIRLKYLNSFTCTARPEASELHTLLFFSAQWSFPNPKSEWWVSGFVNTYLTPAEANLANLQLDQLILFTIPVRPMTSPKENLRTQTGSTRSVLSIVSVLCPLYVSFLSFLSVPVAIGLSGPSGFSGLSGSILRLNVLPSFLRLNVLHVQCSSNVPLSSRSCVISHVCIFRPDVLDYVHTFLLSTQIHVGYDTDCNLFLTTEFTLHFLIPM